MRYNKNTVKHIAASNKRFILVIGLLLLLVAPAYAINSTKSLAQPDITTHTLADAERFEQDVLPV